MKTKFLQRVLWLMIPLLTIFTTNVWGTVPTGWSQVTSLSGMAAGDKIIIVTNDGSMYLNGTVNSSGHFEATVLNASNPASASAAGVIELVSTGTTDRYKLKLVSTNKYLTATAAKSGSASASASSDSYGWQFESSASGEFDARYQESDKNAYCRSYSNSSFRTYGNKSGATFQIYKYSSTPTYNVYLINGCTGGSYSSNKGTSGSGTGGYSSCTKYSGITAGTSVTITATPSSGYQFDGWTDGGYSIILDDSPSANKITPSSTTTTPTITATFTMPSSDVVIWTCNFSEECTNGTVTYAKGTVPSGGGSITGSHASSTKVCETNLTLPGETFHTTGYTQDGWATSDGGDKAYNLGLTTYSTEGDATLYPHWVANQYTVIWKSNGSIVRTDNNVNYQTAKTPPTISPLPCGDKLAGWTDAANGAYVHGTSTLYTSATITITGDKTFYAVFADYVTP